MKNDVHFWVATMIRGALALLVGSAILIVPDMTDTLVLLPMAMIFSVLCLGCYGVLDNAIVLVTSFNAFSRTSRLALQLQGVIGLGVGLLLVFVVYERVQLHWFLTLIACQALFAAIGEFLIARHAVTRATSLWNYSAAAVAILCGLAYAVADFRYRDSLLLHDTAWLIYGYLVAFGLAQCLTAARMLYADRRILATVQDIAA